MTTSQADGSELIVIPSDLKEARRVQRHGAVGEHEADGLEAADGLTEGVPILRVAHRRLQRRRPDAHRLRGDADAPAVHRLPR